MKGRRSFNGRESQRLRGKRAWLVESNRANFWYPYRNVEQAITAAGLP